MVENLIYIKYMVVFIMSFDGYIGLRNKDELMNDYLNFHIGSLKNYSPLSERDLFPFDCDGVESFKYDLSLCLMFDIKLKGKRNILKNHSDLITDDLDLIKNELYKHYVGNLKLKELYGNLDDKDWGIDGDWYNIINNYCKDVYGFYFVDYNILKIQVNNAKQNSCNVDNLCYWLSKKVNANKENWKDVLEFS